mmetsp:Transcript_20355/g.58872  ORF Transcript_20355/g.58872 Transcript_20355/m.58872 type:complete len:135 (-) Transcript_20355:471-875(-)
MPSYHRCVWCFYSLLFNSPVMREIEHKNETLDLVCISPREALGVSFGHLKYQTQVRETARLVCLDLVPPEFPAMLLTFISYRLSHTSSCSRQEGRWMGCAHPPTPPQSSRIPAGRLPTDLPSAASSPVGRPWRP